MSFEDWYKYNVSDTFSIELIIFIVLFCLCLLIFTIYIIKNSRNLDVMYLKEYKKCCVKHIGFCNNGILSIDGLVLSVREKLDIEPIIYVYDYRYGYISGDDFIVILTLNGREYRRTVFRDGAKIINQEAV